MTNPADALARGAWEDARAAYERDLARAETPEGLEGFATAAWWLLDYPAAIDARERACNLYKERGELPAAARMALWNASDHHDRGDSAVANGWLRRAQRFLEGAPPSAEHAFLAIIRGHLAIMGDADPSGAIALAGEARSAARAAGAFDFEMLALALDGLARVSRGEVPEGMARLDEATAAATGGEMSDLNAIGWTCCYLIHACYRVRDYERAAQWCDRVQAFCRRWRFDSMFTTCRTHYASILMWRGELESAEQELATLGREAEGTLPPLVRSAAVRLGELRRRQGRLDEAEELFGRGADHKLSILGRAALALDRDSPREAVALLDTLLRRTPAENRSERLSAVELLARAHLAAGDLSAAARAVRELREIANVIGTEPLRASATFAEGLLAAARGEPDAARAAIEDALHTFETTDARYEAERARAALRRLEAPAERDDAPRTASRSGLTGRELQVLRLVADGLTDREVAARLGISEHTVHRHVSNILTKTGQSSRTAAVARAARDGLL